MAQAIFTDGAWVELTPPFDFPVTVTLDGEPTPLHLTHGFVASLDAGQLADFNIATIVEPGAPPEGQYLAGSTLTDDGGAPVRMPVWEDIPAPAVPEAVTQLQFRRALRHFELYAAVMAFVGGQDEETQEAFNFASMIRRDSPLLNGGANALLGSEAAGQAKLNEVFVYAATVVE